MSNERQDDLTAEERVIFSTYSIAADLASHCRQLWEMDVSVSATALEKVVNALMTEFWDQGFSQTDIRKAFAEALYQRLLIMTVGKRERAPPLKRRNVVDESTSTTLY